MQVIISCTKLKKDYPCTVEEMYSPSWMFVNFVKYAREVLHADDIYILSAKYGVLRLDDNIEPYNLYINDVDKSSWREMVWSQLDESGFDFDEPTVLLCGGHYVKWLTDYLIEYQWPVKNLQFGKIKHFLIEELSKIKDTKEE